MVIFHGELLNNRSVLNQSKVKPLGRFLSIQKVMPLGTFYVLSQFHILRKIDMFPSCIWLPISSEQSVAICGIVFSKHTRPVFELHKLFNTWPLHTIYIYNTHIISYTYIHNNVCIYILCVYIYMICIYYMYIYIYHDMFTCIIYIYTYIYWPNDWSVPRQHNSF